ncbi:hypothetical protein PoB_005907200 [Plakobranchus ocellatus]|uniref:Uncharacterized protein n=1 Tax=Plakobranchus ocellatus TaxID=259542 RepID=A0AAV4CLX4_9GAST|nr:hypothetical protein PoB_005907200 [Plakobranchus ocellatus]
MAHELVVLSNIQVAETPIDQKNLTLSWDASTLDGVHLNEIHISMPGQSLCVDIRKLPGATSSDYLQHISDALFNTASTYVRFKLKGLLEAATALKLHRAISNTNTLTDPAAANHATVMKLQNLFNSQLLEMNCNMHVLDGFATAARQADRKAGIQSAFRGESRTILCIAAVSKLRCSQLGILCDIQCAELLNNAESLTLAWEATTLKDNHINQIVSSKDRFISLDTDLLPGGTSED